MTEIGGGPDEDRDTPLPLDDAANVDADLTLLTRDELRRRTEAPLPRSLIDFLQ